MDIIEIVKTGTRAQALLYSVVNDHAELCQRQIETLSNFKSINQQLAHCIGAEERWQARLIGESPDKMYEAKRVNDINQLHSDWKITRDETNRIIEKQGSEMLESVFDVTLARLNLEIKMTGEQIIYHIIVHESYHRGQCSFLLQMFGVDPPNFDLPLMLNG